jgi:hypothetical protein
LKDGAGAPKKGPARSKFAHDLLHAFVLGGIAAAVIGGGLIFHGVLEALHDAGVIAPH